MTFTRVEATMGGVYGRTRLLEATNHSLRDGFTCNCGATPGACSRPLCRAQVTKAVVRSARPTGRVRLQLRRAVASAVDHQSGLRAADSKYETLPGGLGHRSELEERM